MVVDASAVAAVIFGEPEAEQIRQPLRSQALYAPDLIDYELASVCRKKALRYPEQRAVLLAALEIGLHMPIHRVHIEPLAVMRLALGRALTVYDASYLWLARQLSQPLLTLDQELARHERQRQQKRD
jgi:predicted nucleic acid-binding protein